MSKSKISDRIDVLLNQANEQVEFMETRVILLDNEKSDLDNAIEAIDASVQTEIDNVNSQIKAVSDAYKARITAGCTTLKAWSSSVSGIGTTAVYSFTCVELSPAGVGATTVLLNQDYTTTSYSPGARPGFSTKNLYGIKYYDEPHTLDVTDSLVGSFIGTIGIGTTTLTIMSLASSGVKENMKVGNLVVSNKSGTFAGITSIVGFSTAETDLSVVGIGSTGDIEVVDVLILTSVSALDITAPMTDGTFVQFDVLKNSEQLDVTGIPITSSPLVPQTIGIMNSSTLGIGTYVKYDNSGNNNVTQSWNPFLKGVTQKKITITEPVVGAGYTIYYVGYGYTPAIYIGGVFDRYPTDGETLGIGETYVYISTPTCSTQQTNLTNALNTLSTTESEISAGVATFNNKLTVSNTLRTERNRYTMQIWGARQTLSELEKDAANLSAAKNALSDSSIAGILT